jgi:hypothetical protein
MDIRVSHYFLYANNDGLPFLFLANKRTVGAGMKINPANKKVSANSAGKIEA